MREGGGRVTAREGGREDTIVIEVGRKGSTIIEGRRDGGYYCEKGRYMRAHLRFEQAQLKV